MKSGRVDVKSFPNIDQGFQSYKDGIPGQEFIDRITAGVINIVETRVHNLRNPPFKEVKHTVCLIVTGHQTSKTNNCWNSYGACSAQIAEWSLSDVLAEFKNP